MTSPTISRVALALAERSEGDVATLQATLMELLDAGRRAWPGIDVAEETFFDHLLATLEREKDARAALDQVQAGDLYLAAACAAHHRAALEEFERRYIADVPRALARLRPSLDFVEEVQQLLREKLLMPRDGRPARIADYAGRGALGAWVRVSALRTALSLRRRRQAEPSPNTLPDQVALTPGPEVRTIRQRYRSVVKSALQRALKSIGEADRRLLRRHTIEGLTVEELGVELGVHGSTVSRRLSKVRRAVLEETRRYLMSEAQIASSDLGSLIIMLRSELDVSVARLLADQDD